MVPVQHLSWSSWASKRSGWGGFEWLLLEGAESSLGHGDRPSPVRDGATSLYEPELRKRRRFSGYPSHPDGFTEEPLLYEACGDVGEVGKVR